MTTIPPDRCRPRLYKQTIGTKKAKRKKKKDTHTHQLIDRFLNLEIAQITNSYNSTTNSTFNNSKFDTQWLFTQMKQICKQQQNALYKKNGPK